MKKNFLTPVLESKAVTAVTTYCKDHKSTLIAGGTIGSSFATTAMVFKNSPMIHDIIWDTKAAIAAANNDEEKKSIYKAALKDLAPLVGEILIFQAATITLVIIAKKDSDKKEQRIAELTSAVAVASQVIDQYESFKKEAEEELGEKKLEKVRKRVSDKAAEGVVVEEKIELNPGEVIFRDHYCGHIFKGTQDTVRLACERLSGEIKDNDWAVLNGEYYQSLGIEDIIGGSLGDKFGFYAENDRMYIQPNFIPISVNVNGTTMPAYDVYLTPEPEYIEV